ncbi:hypothetical protein SADUNF_Sadunf18G0087700 [Salix dunnii]|uniref:AP2/ERF domain-containing protein n=1 Tax=Salix dunnii TaxID=1413687 RepID=A0A835J3W9_9ROSI|nr:hypothetical protein SADUNF_Sadunf18G0087700 [Salix dunnii]
MGGDWLQYFRCAALVSDLSTPKEGDDLMGRKGSVMKWVNEGAGYGRAFMFPLLGRCALFCGHEARGNGRLLFPAVRNSMEEENVSLILNGKTSVAEEFSDSNSSTHPFPASKRARSGCNGSASIFGVVVPLPNGHWGCQIYANPQRIWLGTFKSEKEAALAYDNAAI